jgi:quinohemoprotein ethanol dehydrogenase
MSFSPTTGLVYIPTIETGNILADIRHNPGSQLSDMDQTMGVTEILPDKSLSYGLWESMVGGLPRFPAVAPGTGKPILRGVLKAWDPVKRGVVWEQQTSQDYLVLDGGALSTAGGLVFAGREDGHFVAYDGATGIILKDIDTGSAIMAAPMTYAVNGKQYVSVLCGHGGTFFNFLGTAALKYVNEGRIITFALDGAIDVPKPDTRPKAPPYAVPPPKVGSPELVAAGRNLFFMHCARCHSLDVPAITPDLSRMSNEIGSVDAFKAVILKGVLLPLGMPRFDDILSEGDAYALHSFLISQSWELYEAQQVADKTTQH